MPKIRVELKVPNDCKECDHRYGNKCWLFDRELTMYDNGGDDWGYDWGFIRCKECEQAEVEE